MPRHEAADDLADKARRLKIQPTMTPKEGERLIWGRHRDWYMSPALADAIPNVSSAERKQLTDAFDELDRQFRRAESLEELRRQAEASNDELADIVQQRSANSHDSEPEHQAKALRDYGQLDYEGLKKHLEANPPKRRGHPIRPEDWKILRYAKVPLLCPMADGSINRATNHQSTRRCLRRRKHERPGRRRLRSTARLSLLETKWITAEKGSGSS